MPILDQLTPEEQEKLNAYRAEAKAVREAGAGNWSAKKDMNTGSPMEPSNLLIPRNFLQGFSAKLDDIFGNTSK